MRFVLILIALAVYFGGGWIFKDIAFSMIEFSGDTTMGDILFYECCVYSAITGLVCMLFAKDEDDYFVPLVIVAGACIATRFLPISTGLVILYNIVNVCAMIWVCLKRD